MIQLLLKQATQQLSSFSETPLLDAELILSFVLNVPRLSLRCDSVLAINAEQKNQFTDFIEKRAQGIPVAYLVGKKAFWSLDLDVNQFTLVPRPETELLVETALTLFPKKETMSVADMGVGAGTIALALAAERPQWQILAVDNSEEALQIAKRNAENYLLFNVSFLKSHWFSVFPKQKYNLIVSNPPYLADQDPYLVTDIRHEPRSALVSGPTGLESLAHLIADAPTYLFCGGCLMLEHGSQQGADVRHLFAMHQYEKIVSLKDIAGHERVTYGFVQK